VNILDLGASDGAIAKWLTVQFPDARVDCVELNEHRAAKARKRVGAHGQVKVGRAEDAPHLFEPGTYDAVVAFELIEHVPDVDQLLDACERMVKPGGRIYLSTPDGTWGHGNNPAHLRVYRLQDLADVLRRRGRVVSIMSAPDQITCAAYTPTRRGPEVVIHTAGGWQRWHPTDVALKGLGGSETWATRLAEHLDDLGCVVTVYGEVEDCLHQGAIFRHHERWDPTVPCDLFIASRAPQLIDARPRARTSLLWVHDVDCGDHLTPERADRFDHVVSLSGWHDTHLQGRYPFLGSRLLRSRNGIEHGMFRPLAWKDRKPRLLYTSSPDRGLDVMLELWPRVREGLPAGLRDEAVFSFCYPDVYDAVADQQPQIAAHRDRIRRLSEQPGVERLGSLPQPTLAAVMCDSRVWAHPSWCTSHPTPDGGTFAGPFHETSCIGAVEAQAAGMHVVASGWGALKETVRYGHLLDAGDPTEARWRDAMVTSIVEGLADPGTGNAAVDKAPPAVADLSWRGVAEQVLAVYASLTGRKAVA
jgi:glycosyltransferase involved in cell wall biosynthesis